MADVPFHHVTLRSFAYATEDEKRVLDALQEIVPAETKFDRSVIEGHHGDSIVLLEATLDSSGEIAALLERLPGVPGFDRLRTDISERIDEDVNLFMRFDKQRAFQGELAFGEGVHLQGKVEAYPANREAAIDSVTEALDEFAEAYHGTP